MRRMPVWMIFVDANNNIIIAGITSGYNQTVNYDFGNGILLYGKGNFVAKFNSDGVCQWAKLINYNIAGSLPYTEGIPLGLGVLPNNEIYFAGRSNNANKPFWLLKIDANGNEVWHKEWILPEDNYVGITTSKTGSFFDNTGKAYFIVSNLTGNTIIFDNTPLVPPNGTHPAVYSIVTIDGNGNNDLFTTYRGVLSDIAVEKSTGNVLLKWGQYQLNPAPFNIVPTTANGVYEGIVGIDTNRNFLGCTQGILLTQNDIEFIFPLGNLDFAGTDLLQATEQITAGSQSFTATNKTPVWKFFENFNMTKFVAHPEILGSSNYASTYPLMAMYGNKVAVSGSYGKADNTTITVNGTTLTACEYDLNFGTDYPNYASITNDVFISQLNTQFNLGTINNNILNEITIFPNPTSAKLNLKSSVNLDNANLKIISLTGQTVFEKQNLSGLDFSFDVSKLSSGLYIIEITKKSHKETLKFIKD